MTPEDKDLVLRDLCARLPYEVKCRFEDTIRTIDGESSPCYDSVLSAYHLEIFIRLNDFYIKPYLRPLSSMTEEEHNEWFNYYHEIELKEAKSTGDYLKAAILGESASIDWLNKKMFDYRDLIPKNLAIEVTEDNNPYKDFGL